MVSESSRDRELDMIIPLFLMRPMFAVLRAESG